MPALEQPADLVREALDVDRRVDVAVVPGEMGRPCGRRTERGERHDGNRREHGQIAKRAGNGGAVEIRQALVQQDQRRSIAKGGLQAPQPVGGVDHDVTGLLQRVPNDGSALCVVVDVKNRAMRPTHLRRLAPKLPK